MDKIKEISSPNFSDRQENKIEIIVIHIMVGTLEGTNSWFSSSNSQVSAHYGVGLNGEIVRYVPDEKKAWHAGMVNNPTFKLYKQNINPNLYTLGIECEGNDLSFAPEIQLNSLIKLIASLVGKWSIPIDRDHIIGHYEINSVTRPNCPATNKSIIDTIVRRVKESIPSPLTKEQIKSKIMELVNQL